MSWNNSSKLRSKEVKRVSPQRKWFSYSIRWPAHIFLEHLTASNTCNKKTRDGDYFFFSRPVTSQKVLLAISPHNIFIWFIRTSIYYHLTDGSFQEHKRSDRIDSRDGVRVHVKRQQKKTTGHKKGGGGLAFRQESRSPTTYTFVNTPHTSDFHIGLLLIAGRTKKKNDLMQLGAFSTMRTFMQVCQEKKKKRK